MSPLVRLEIAHREKYYSTLPKILITFDHIFAEIHDVWCELVGMRYNVCPCIANYLQVSFRDFCALLIGVTEVLLLSEYRQPIFHISSDYQRSSTSEKCRFSQFKKNTDNILVPYVMHFNRSWAYQAESNESSVFYCIERLIWKMNPLYVGIK